MDEIALDDFKSRFADWPAEDRLNADRVVAEFLAFARTPSLADGTFSDGDQIIAEASVWSAADVRFAEENGSPPVVAGDVMVLLSRDIPTYDENGDYDGRLAAGVGLHVAAEHAAAIPTDLMVGAELDGAVDDSPAPEDYERGTFLGSVDAFEGVLRRLAPGLATVPVTRLSIDELQRVD